MQRSAEFYRGALWHWGTGCNRADLVELLAEAEVREVKYQQAAESSQDPAGEAIMPASEASVPTAAETDLGTASPTRTGTMQVTLRNGRAGKPLEYADETPIAADLDSAAPLDLPSLQARHAELAVEMFNAESRLEKAAEVIAAAERALESVSFECDGKADCDDGPDGIANVPNLAMRCEMAVEPALALITKWKEAK